MEKVSFICSLWGTKYEHEYVQKLYNAVKRNYIGDFDFYCQTDQPINIKEVINLPIGKYPLISDSKIITMPYAQKFNIWEPNCWGISGLKVYLDIDILILGNLNRLINVYKHKPMIGRAWWQDENGVNHIPMNHTFYRGITNGSIYIWKDNEITEDLWNHIEKYYPVIARTSINGTDGYFSSMQLDKFDFVPREMMYSYHNETVADPYSYVICTVDTKKFHISTKRYMDQREISEIPDKLIMDNWI